MARERGHYRYRIKPSYLSSHSVESIKKKLEHREVKLELLEKASKLKKLQRKYKSFDPVETWATRWVACPIAYLFSTERREEWLGDLYELNWEMLHKDYPRWLVSVINIARTVILVISAFEIKVTELFAFRVRKSK